MVILNESFLVQLNCNSTSKIKSMCGQFWGQLTTPFPDRQLGVKSQQECTNSQPHPATQIARPTAKQASDALGVPSVSVA